MMISKKVIDLTGKKFNRLTVIRFLYTRSGETYWSCKCDCGNEKITSSRLLKKGSAKSCGCHRIIDLTGKRFGFLTVIEKAEKRKGLIYWLCKCDCGKNTTVYGASLRNGQTKSCGCYHRTKCLNKRFGKLTVKSFSHVDNHGHVNVNCKCDCGNEIIVMQDNLIRKHTKSCGCSKQEFSKQTCMEKYGVEFSFQDKQIREKIKKTCIKKYGVENAGANKTIREKIKQTCLQKYGTEYPASLPEIAKRSARAQINSYNTRHWKTEEEIVCVASYEKAVVEYLNKNKIDFKWQHRIFTMPDGRTYRPDCYLLDEDLYVEIKGFFRKDAKEKWEWFHKEYINSELWDQNKLREMGIL